MNKGLHRVLHLLMTDVTSEPFILEKERMNNEKTCKDDPYRTKS